MARKRRREESLTGARCSLTLDEALESRAFTRRSGVELQHSTDDVRIEGLNPLIPPAILLEEIPLDEAAASLVAQSRQVASDIVSGRDDRLLAVVGPCSIHDPKAALDYARQLLPVAKRLEKDVFVIMRVYFEKPRTTVGWKGLINDPRLDGSFRVNEGLRTARRLLIELAALGMPAGCEFLDPITPQFFADVVSWGAIGARTTESQVHRELASGLSMPVGFKNGTGGSIQMAVDACRAAKSPHHFLSVTKQGLAAIVSTMGNPDTHVILRGGNSGPNYDAETIARTAKLLNKAGLSARVMVDCSHGNSGKDANRQPAVASAVAAQLSAGNEALGGVMIESHLVGGRQDYVETQPLTYGQSITDECLGLDQTVPVLEELAQGVRNRRVARQAKSQAG